VTISLLKFFLFPTNIFSLEAAIDQVGLSDYIIVEVFSFFLLLSSFLLNCFIMSSFEDELRRQGLLEDLAALPALAVSGRVPSTTGGCRMILAFLLVLEGIPEGCQV
jgi:ABC-type multidrug transport system permease subunit